MFQDDYGFNSPYRSFMITSDKSEKSDTSDTSDSDAGHSGQVVYLARHGHREDFIGDKWGDRWHRTAERPHDPALSEIGVRQAQELGERLRAGDDGATIQPIRHVFASPFLRTVETAAHVAAALGLTVKIEGGICEWLNPEWYRRAPAFLPPEEMERRFPGRIDLSYTSRVVRAFPESDERDDAWPHVRETMARLIAQYGADGPLLFVGHGSSVAGMAWALGGDEAAARLAPKMCSLVRFQRSAPSASSPDDPLFGWEMTLPGCVRHLSVTEEVLRFH